MAAVENILLAVFIVTSIFISAIAQDTYFWRDEWSVDQCEAAASCSECTTNNPKCGWCSKPGYEDEGASRCDTIIRLKKNNCQDQYITYPRNTQYTKKTSSFGGKARVQIQPQEVSLKLRPKEPYPLVVKVMQVKDYPVDLYYLMDLSYSMKDDKDKLAELGDLLAEHMAKITSNFKLGFGSFVDKTIMPYTNMRPEKLREPCPECAAPYGFRNHMSLSANSSRFSAEVNAARVSGNLDAPEGGFDAIMQAMVCRRDIGWRPQSRKLLVFSTDSGFHTAGDGKLGGIVTPNDESCHMTRNNMYGASTLLDYPSVSQIDKMAQEHKVNIIFAVTASQVPMYDNVVDLVEGSSSGVLASDSSNVVELIKEQYNKITSKVDMRDTAPKDFVQINYFSKCLGNLKEATNKCEGLKVGDQVEFEAEITVLKCPEDKNQWQTSFFIYPVGLEPMRVYLTVLCECECEKSENKVRNSPDCTNGNGTFSCGVCDCNVGRYGRYCECDGITSGDNNREKCYRKGDNVPCSGNGDCVCDRCICNSPLITGKKCECNNFDCARYNGLLCSGEANGDCICGTCQCKNNRTGRACECPSVEFCNNPETKEECSGNGICNCGRCECAETESGIYTGQYCEKLEPKLSKCIDFEECVLCTVHDKDDESCSNCTQQMTIETQSSVEEEEDEILCLVETEDDDGCKIRYVYSFNGTHPMIRAEDEPSCPEGLGIWAVIWGIIAALLVLLIGLLLLLLWKLWARYQDRRDYAKFERETESAKWDTGGNPLFKAATTTFKNPTYAKK